MAIFDYNTEAELSPTESEVELFPTRSRRTREPLGFGRFARAADAIRFAIEELPPKLLLAAQLKVGEKRFGGDGIRRLYESAEYPLARRADDAVPYNNRGNARRKKGDLDGAIKDYAEAIRLKPDFALAYNNRGVARRKGDLDGAIMDYAEAIRLKPDFALAYNNRGVAHSDKGDLDGAIKDYAEAIRLKPDYALAYNNRGIARRKKGDLDGAIKDSAETIRLKPDFALAYYNRGLARRKKGDLADVKAAIADFQKYLDGGGGMCDGDQAEVEQFIRDLKKKP